MEPAVVAAEPDVLEPDVLELELDESLELEDEAPLVELLLDESPEELLDEPVELDDLLDPPDRLSVL